ncbi:alpha/beta fold hydrolase [Rubrobacter marinus]|uniref:alpha/beta fold hydrolase n=1 Tax=Rubrobacter marinus TaxID=2653852 RepID=UPI0014079276|nr:alpha/beta fold hydrolase [Rubrobacter marinus]
MSTFVLIHGAYHGKWCWEKLAPLLEREGHEAVAVDLPGHGEDGTPVGEVTLQDYTDRVCEVLRRQSGPVVLVGHSLSGIAISQAAEQCPGRIEKLVYLSALLLPNGKSAAEASQEDPESVISESTELDAENGRLVLEDAGITDALYNDCSEEDVERARRMVGPQPLAPLATPVQLTQGNYGGVRRTYVKTLRDRAVSPAVQEKMLAEMPCEKVVSMETGHMSFFADPENLAKNLDSLARL